MRPASSTRRWHRGSRPSAALAPKRARTPRCRRLSGSAAACWPTSTGSTGPSRERAWGSWPLSATTRPGARRAGSSGGAGCWCRKGRLSEGAPRSAERCREAGSTAPRPVPVAAGRTGPTPGGLRYKDRAALGSAVKLVDGGPRPLALASALEDLGGAYLTRARNDEGITAFGRALEPYRTAGATWDARRVRGRLRALGVRRRFVSAERPASGWAALTHSELEVVRLVARGLTNPDTA